MRSRFVAITLTIWAGHLLHEMSKTIQPHSLTVAKRQKILLIVHKTLGIKGFPPIREAAHTQFLDRTA